LSKAGYFEKHSADCERPEGGPCNCTPVRFPADTATLPEKFKAALRVRRDGAVATPLQGCVIIVSSDKKRWGAVTLWDGRPDWWEIDDRMEFEFTIWTK
jgi:hypothetical protein